LRNPARYEKNHLELMRPQAVIAEILPKDWAFSWNQTVNVPAVVQT